MTFIEKDLTKEQLKHRELIEYIFNQTNPSILFDINLSKTKEGQPLVVNNYGYMYSLEELEEFRKQALLLLGIIESQKLYMKSIGQDIAAEFNSEKCFLFEQESDRRAISRKKKEKESKTFIYLMYNPTNGFYKIGRSVNPEYREHTLCAQEPEIFTVHQFKGTIQHETLLHAKFDAKRVRGEWFALLPEDVEYITSLNDNCIL